MSFGHVVPVQPHSQYGVGVVNQRQDFTWKACSAGTHPGEYVHPLTIRVLSEIGIQLEGHTEQVDKFFMAPLDMIVSLCGE
ncbi:MAG: hypothetical protein U9R58_14340 [Chloroflexota bacterium]|nr:hypothetical protein [Chloroflexota bacterium]